MLHRLIKAALCIISVAFAGFAVAGIGCSAQGEGERCTHFTAMGPDAGDINGSSECQAGLVCTPMFNTDIYPFDRCCPQNLQDIHNVPACYSSGNPGGAPDASMKDSPSDAPQMEGSPKDASPKDGSPKDSPADAPKSDAPASDAMSDGPSAG